MYNPRFCKREAWSLKMYAVIKTGGKQYRIQVGEKLKIEQIEEIGRAHV